VQSTLPGDTTNWVVGQVVATNGATLPPKSNSAPVQIEAPGLGVVKLLISPTNRAAVVGFIGDYDGIVGSGRRQASAIIPADGSIQKRSPTNRNVRSTVNSGSHRGPTGGPAINESPR